MPRGVSASRRPIASNSAPPAAWRQRRGLRVARLRRAARALPLEVRRHTRAQVAPQQIVGPPSAARVAASGAAASSSSSAPTDANRRAPRALEVDGAVVVRQPCSGARLVDDRRPLVVQRRRVGGGRAAPQAQRVGRAEQPRRAVLLGERLQRARERRLPSMPKGGAHFRTCRRGEARCISSAPHTTNWRSTLTTLRPRVVPRAHRQVEHAAARGARTRRRRSSSSFVRRAAPYKRPSGHHADRTSERGGVIHVNVRAAQPACSASASRAAVASQRCSEFITIDDLAANASSAGWSRSPAVVGRSSDGRAPALELARGGETSTSSPSDSATKRGRREPVRDVREPECYQRRVALDVGVAELEEGRGGVDELAHGRNREQVGGGDRCGARRFHAGPCAPLSTTAPGGVDTRRDDEHVHVRHAACVQCKRSSTSCWRICRTW